MHSLWSSNKARGLLVVVVVVVELVVVVGGGSWCIARSNISDQALQTALDYACGAGADCSPIQSSGLCYLPNTMQAHASYAFNSYYQRKAMAPGSCDFGGTATISITDPSYGSCVFPSSQSTAGGTVTTTPATPILTPSPPTATIGGGFSPTSIPSSTDNSKATTATTSPLYYTSSVFLLLLL